MLDKYIDFQSIWDKEVHTFTTKEEVEQYLEDFEVNLVNCTKEEAVVSLLNPPFPLELRNCELNLRTNQLLFDFSEEYDNSTESGYDVSFSSFFVVYDIEEECIVLIGEEHG